MSGDLVPQSSKSSNHWSKSLMYWHHEFFRFAWKDLNTRCMPMKRVAILVNYVSVSLWNGKFIIGYLLSNNLVFLHIFNESIWWISFYSPSKVHSPPHNWMSRTIQVDLNVLRSQYFEDCLNPTSFECLKSLKIQLFYRNRGGYVSRSTRKSYGVHLMSGVLGF